MVADVAPEELRGTAFGVFNFVSGVATATVLLLLLRPDPRLRPPRPAPTP